MEKLVEFSPAYDKRDPDPNKNYGIHGVNCRFILKGELGAVQFLIFTNWYLPHVQKEFNRKGYRSEVMPADVGYHSPRPMYDGQKSLTDDCEYIGGKCFYDGSGLYAEKMFDILLTQGGDGVWIELEKYYTEKFGELR